MTQKEWDKKLGEKIRCGGFLWRDIWCSTIAAMIVESDGSHLWTFDKYTGVFKDEKRGLDKTQDLWYN